MKKPFSRLEVFARIERLLDGNLSSCRGGSSPSARPVSPVRA